MFSNDAKRGKEQADEVQTLVATFGDSVIFVTIILVNLIAYGAAYVISCWCL